MTVGHHRNTVATIDLAAIRHNVAHKKHQLEEHQELYAVVKANGYGHGMVPVAKAAKQAGATGFCVAILDEALELRRAGFEEPIIVLGVSKPEDIGLFIRYQIRATVPSTEWFKAALEVMRQQAIRGKLFVHVKLDTGMGRIGIRELTEVHAMDALLQAQKGRVVFEGVFTHFAKADSPDTAHANQQLNRFVQLIQAFDEMPRYVHCANSAWAIWHELNMTEIVRYGVAMYGIDPSNGDWAIPEPEDLKPALRLDTEIVHVKQLHKGDTVSYGATYVCQEDEWIATLPVGYADGWLRSYKGVAPLVEGRPCPIVGRICMDQYMIRLPYRLPVGTKVTLIGTNGHETITAEQVSRVGDSIGYEVVCLIGERVPRLYVNEEE